METVWTQHLIDELGRLWKEGHSTAEIGRRIGLTKNAVVGKAHRLALQPRPSPLKGPPKRQVVIEFSGPSCSWPIGHPGDKGFRFCDAPPVPGKPYCTEHARMAYIRPKSSSAA